MSFGHCAFINKYKQTLISPTDKIIALMDGHQIAMYENVG